MKYENSAISMHFFSFVFYETDKKGTLYVYCPNCNTVHTFELTKTQNLTWAKNHLCPCDCFEGVIPQYFHSKHEYGNLNRVIHVAEFEKINGKLWLFAYAHKASFAASNYDVGNGCFEEGSYVLKRYPVYTSEKTCAFEFCEDGSVKYYSRLFSNFWSHNICFGEWRPVKSWSYIRFDFDLIIDSLEELKNTALEQFIPGVDSFIEVARELTNLNSDYYAKAFLPAFFVQLYKSNALKKLWKSGYYTLAFQRVVETMFPNNSCNENVFRNMYKVFPIRNNRLLNFNGKTIEKIIKIKPSQTDMLVERKKLNYDNLEAISLLNKYNLSLTKENFDIASAINAYFDFKRIKRYADLIFMSKTFKYLRHTIRKDNNFEVGDYFDYLAMLDRMNIPFSNDVLYPVRFKVAHDRLAEEERALLSEKKLAAAKKRNGAFRKSIEKYLELTFSNELYSIKVIRSATELVREAAKMHNCAGGYVNDVIKGHSVIFTIKRTDHPRTAFYMLELDPHKLSIVQNRGKYNKQNDEYESVSSFAQNWINTIVLPKMLRGTV